MHSVFLSDSAGSERVSPDAIHHWCCWMISSMTNGGESWGNV